MYMSLYALIDTIYMYIRFVFVVSLMKRLKINMILFSCEYNKIQMIMAYDKERWGTTRPVFIHRNVYTALIMIIIGESHYYHLVCLLSVCFYIFNTHLSHLFFA